MRVYDLAQRGSRRQLINTRFLDMPAYRIHPGSTVLGASQIGEPFAAVANYSGNVRDRFRVVNDGGTAEQSDDRGKRRLQPGPAPLTFERFQKRRLLTADVGPCSEMDYHVQ